MLAVSFITITGLFIPLAKTLLILVEMIISFTVREEHLCAVRAAANQK
ncbi:MAG: hypothetical protein QOD99_2094, partial [Chthoniobacter sp.]|nr:hypothetical protein [Chthoniobacter sp.]